MSGWREEGDERVVVRIHSSHRGGGAWEGTTMSTSGGGVEVSGEEGDRELWQSTSQWCTVLSRCSRGNGGAGCCGLLVVDDSIEQGVACVQHLHGLIASMLANLECREVADLLREPPAAPQREI